MLGETAQEKGCLSGCLTTLTAGGSIGVVLGYLMSRYYLGSNPDRSMALFLQFGFLIFGFTLGAFLWGTIQWIYQKIKTSEKEEI